ncbi:hypothetical protein DITRI_Ditri08aG0113700 [Diplodiscus trichospermus]
MSFGEGEGCVPVKEGQALGLAESLSWIRGMGHGDVIFETDTKYVVDVLYSNVLDKSKFRSIISYCRNQLRYEMGFLFSFMRRQANK